MKPASRHLRDGVALSLLLAGCTMTSQAQAPQGWQQVTLRSGIEMALPPDAVPGGGAVVDSSAGFFGGPDYVITYDIGRYGENVEGLAGEQGFEQRTVQSGGFSWAVASFVPSDEEAAWATVAQAELAPGQTITIRVSCTRHEGCSDLADDVLASVHA